MRYLSLFTGIGGFELGITRAYDNDRNRRNTEESSVDGGDSTLSTFGVRLGEYATCVGYSEIDKYAAQIYQSHFPEHHNYGDITKINEAELPDFDLLCGGFPCQSFSIAGKRGGFADTRGTLFFEIARLLKAKQPRLLLLENVKGLLSHDEGRTFATIISTLDELGYDCQWQVLNSKDFGVPQNRERVFIVGHLRGTSRPQVFPLQGTDGQDTHPSAAAEQGAQGIATRHLSRNGGLLSEHASTLQVAETPHVLVGTLRTYKDATGFREVQSGLAPTIPARAREDGSGQPVVMYDDYNSKLREDGLAGTLTTNTGVSAPRNGQKVVYIPEATKQGYAIAEEGDSINLSVPGSATRRGRVGKGIAQTLDTGMQQYTIHATGVNQPSRGMEARKDGLANTIRAGGGGAQTPKVLLNEVSKTVRSGGRASPHGSKQNWDSYEFGGQIRRLTPTECERLQGFPDGWTAGVSDTQRYKTLGNAVTVNVIEAIISRLI